MIDRGKAFREPIRIVINARYDYLSLGVDKSPFTVLIDTGKAFREFAYTLKLLIEEKSPLVIREIPNSMRRIDCDNYHGVLALMNGRSILALMTTSAHHKHQHAEKE